MIAIIVAYSNNRVIGNKGKIPWTLKNEKKRFKNLTTNNIIVMGRKTFEEIGRPLPDRITVVVSKTKNFDSEMCFTASSLSKAIELCKRRFADKDIFISGGEALYKEALPFAEKLYVTEIDAEIDGDTYFPDFDESEFLKTIEETHLEELSYKYVTYTRKATS